MRFLCFLAATLLFFLESLLCHLLAAQPRAICVAHAVIPPVPCAHHIILIAGPPQIKLSSHKRPRIRIRGRIPIRFCSNPHARFLLTICEFPLPLLNPCQTSISYYRILHAPLIMEDLFFSPSRPHSAALFDNRIYLLHPRRVNQSGTRWNVLSCSSPPNRAARRCASILSIFNPISDSQHRSPMLARMILSAFAAISDSAHRFLRLRTRT